MSRFNISPPSLRKKEKKRENIKVSNGPKLQICPSPSCVHLGPLVACYRAPTSFSLLADMQSPHPGSTSTHLSAPRGRASWATGHSTADTRTPHARPACQPSPTPSSH